MRDLSPAARGGRARTSLICQAHRLRSRQFAAAAGSADRAALDIRPLSIILIVWKNG